MSFVQNDLKGLILHSKTLSPQNREVLLTQTENLNSDQVHQLMSIFLNEKKQLQDIDEKYTIKGQRIIEEYLKVVGEFEHVVIPKTLKKVEGAMRSEEEKNLQTIMDAANSEISTSQVKTSMNSKTKNHKRFILAGLSILLVGGLLYYFFLLIS